MVQARRKRIVALLEGTDDRMRVSPKEIHAGLWWDKYLPKQKPPRSKEGKNADVIAARQEHIAQMASHAQPTGYWQALQRWQRLLHQQELQGLCLKTMAESEGRMILGIGDKGPLEVGLRLDHTWGVPLLPGSSLKGLAATAAHTLLTAQEWRRGGEWHQFLFGNTEEAGAIEFLDAWWIPNNGDEELPIDADVMTVHHPDYYQNRSELCPPSDTDSPNPISFATTRGRYLIAVRARAGLWTRETEEDRDTWLEIALRILERGLRELGIGAKTNAGYGRMKLDSVLSLEDRREQRRKSHLTPEQLWVESHSDLLASDAKQQKDWLLSEAERIPKELNGDLARWKALLKQQLAPGCQELRELLERDPEADIRKRREELEKERCSPPPGKGKAKKKWRNRIEKEERSLAEQERRIGRDVSEQKSIRKLLGWLDS